MNKKVIRLIIIFTSVSLSGLIFTQLFWIRNAIDLSGKQFGHRVDIALSDLVYEIKRGKPDSLQYNSILDVVNANHMDSLLRKYVNYHNLDDTYMYAIVRSKDDSLIYSSDQDTTVFSSSINYKVCMSCLWSKDHYYLKVVFPFQEEAVLYDLGLWLILSALFLFIVLVAFSTNVWAIIRQKRLADIKNDFVNNMTHELKTPISTISLASEVLLDSGAEHYPQRVKHYAGIIFDENQKMRQQVDYVLQMALMEKGEFNLNKTKTEIHQLIRDSVHNLCLERCKKPVSIKYIFNAEKSVLNIDPMHVSNIIANLVENAYKYSGKQVEITISTQNNQGGLVISVSDNGLGINVDAQKNIFDKFYRVPTGAVHNVKGFGLGLYYVKTLTEAHNGTVTVGSKAGKGSTFDVFLPF